MTDQEQQRANHLALVAAPLLALAITHGETATTREQAAKRMNDILAIAEALQRAAEERVAKP